MNTDYIFNQNQLFAQVYGGDSYGTQIYNGCEQAAENCTTTTETPPNTGFLGLSPDAAVASAGGALLVALAIVGVVYVVFSRRRANLTKKSEK